MYVVINKKKMVKICDTNNYSSENEEKYKEHFDKFNYPLHIFQKYAIEGIVEGHHVLVTAPTGSGKSLPAEFSLDFFVSKGKKVIYCSPIKALSNQKFDDFSKKYPHISVGIITGDIKCNPDADVLIMTTEILLNKLYQLKSGKTEILLNKDKSGGTTIKNNSTSFDMDIENELRCVIFDEIHMINDPSRGHVWESSIMMLPRHIQMVGLSATLDNPERFASWLENRESKSEQNEKNVSNEKIVYLTKKFNRAVPLTHYSFITANNGVNKHIKDKAIQAEIRSLTDKTFVIQDANGVFNEQNYRNMDKMVKLFDAHDIHVKRAHVLNKVSEFLVEKEMLPAICYVFSRKQLEVCAHEINTNLLEFDSKIPYTIDRECEQIIRKLPNYKEYLNLPEYLDMVHLLRKGVAMHHSGLMPILREIVEILFAKGYIKMLFATESVAIGLNLPVKTCIFTDIFKHDGNSMRVLQAHEYSQSSGRAGRLGLDTVGHVIHLNNLFRDISATAYKTMMNGQPQTLTSKFKISYNLLLNLIDIGDTNLVGFAKKSMVTDDLTSKIKHVSTEIDKCQKEVDRLDLCFNTMRTPKDIVQQYMDLQRNKDSYANKKRKEMEKEIQKIKDEYMYVEQDLVTIQNYTTKVTELHSLQKQYDRLNNYINDDVENVLYLLREEGFLVTLTSTTKVSEVSVEATLASEVTITDTTVVSETSVEKECLTVKGKMASQLREVHCLVFARLLEDGVLYKLTTIQLISLFSCFTNISVQEGVEDFTPYTDDYEVKDIICNINEMYNEYQQTEINYRINTGSDYNIHYDLLNYVEEWSNSESVDQCKLLLQKIEYEKGIFLGEFVKALLKINNIASELEKIAEMIGNIEFLSKLREIPGLTLKFVVTNQSLYI
jgi:superfamily II RNA helicase